MPHVSHNHEAWALRLLSQIIALDKLNRDALPGSVVKHAKAAIKILQKRQKKGRDSKRVSPWPTSL